MTEKAAFELNMVRALFDAIPSLRQRSWRTSAHPEIDVIVARLDGGIVGVEVTRLHPTGGEEAREWEETQNAIIKRAQAKYESKGLPSLEVVVFWSVWIDPTAAKREKIAQDLDAFVTAHTPTAGEACEFDLGDENSPKLPHAIDRIQVRRFPGGDYQRSGTGCTRILSSRSQRSSWRWLYDAKVSEQQAVDSIDELLAVVVELFGRDEN